MRQSESSCFPAKSKGGTPLAGSILLAVTMSLLSGCNLFKDTAAKNPLRQGVGTDYISIEREHYRRHNHRFVCLVVSRDGRYARYDAKNETWTGAEIDVIRKIAKRLSMEVDFVEATPYSASAAIRNGNGDVAIGCFTETEIQTVHLRAVAPYALPDTKAGGKPDNQGKAPKYYLMVRNADTAWATALSE